MQNKKCFHCNLQIYSGDKYSIFLNEKICFFCCPGCLAVAEFIIKNRLSDYYLYRDKPGFNVNEKILLDEKNLSFYDNEKNYKKNSLTNENLYSAVVAIDGISCAACTWLIERHLNIFPGIEKISVNLVSCRAFIVFNINLIKFSSILNEFKKLGYLAYPYTLKQQELIYKNEYKKELKKLIIAFLGMSQVMMLSVALYTGITRDMHNDFLLFIRWTCFFITFPVLIFSARDIFYNAFLNLKFKNFGMDVAVSLSLLIAFAASIFNLFFQVGDVYFDSICMFVFFLLISRFLEMRARHHSGEIIYSLQKISIDKATVFKECNNLIEEIIISADNIKIGDVLLVKPGELIPVDGEIIDGYSNINESMITGESFPVFKSLGDKVIGGTLNIENKLTIKSLKEKGYSTIDIIVKLLEQINSTKVRSSYFIDLVSGYFTLTILILTTLVSLIWIKLENENLINVILSMLIVACPCALSIATPVAITHSINTLAKKGFLITKEHVFEYLDKITDVVFDKTGTLTVNNFIIDKIKLNKNLNLKDVISIAINLERTSSHPISRAFLSFKLKYENLRYSQSDIKNIPNEGIQGKINDEIYRIGKPNFIKNWVNNYTDFNFKNKGICIVLANKKNILAWFNIINPIRKNLIECVTTLKSIGMTLHILSGDSSDSVNHIANLLKIKNRYKNFTSNDKFNYVKNLNLKNSNVLMVGDGINDALALNVAKISIAMGNAIDLTKINSDIILLNNNLNNIIIAIKHTKKTKNIIKQNIIWAIFYNIAGLSLAGFDMLTPYYAAIGMSASSLVVIFNSLRLKKTYDTND